MEEQFEALLLEGLRQVRAAADLNELEAVRVAYLGKKGRLTVLLRGMGTLPPQERPALGRLANSVRDRLEEAVSQRRVTLAEAALEERLLQEELDVTLPGEPPVYGGRHPLALVLSEIEDIFKGLGYAVAEGPEVEMDYYNFEALNIPADHPARDMQDSFYLTGRVLLRTHTSPVQVRVMQERGGRLPIRIIAPGKVYRRDDDATHSPMFHQVEGLLVDRGVTLADLKGTLLTFARLMFGAEREIRLRPSYFPFTEPSAEVDISCISCGGKGCRVCSQTGWLEILGCGLVHPKVLTMSGYDPGQVSGFAFGMGVERIAMLKYGIDDLRLLFENDLRFLEQF